MERHHLRGAVRIALFLIAGFVALDGAAGQGQQAGQKPPANAVATPAAADTRKAVPPKAPAKAPAKTMIALPEAHVGQPYAVKVYLPSTIAAGWIHYALTQAPKWLQFEESTSTFRGIPNDLQSGTYKEISLALTSTADPNAKAQNFTFTLPVVSGPDQVFPAGVVPNHAALPDKTKADEVVGLVVTDGGSKPFVIPSPAARLTADLTTTSLVITGKIDPDTLPFPIPASAPAGGAAPASNPPPANYPLLSVEVTDPISKLKSLLPLQQPGAKPGAQAGGPQAALPINADGTFSIPLPALLTDKETVRLIAVPPTGYTFDSNDSPAFSTPKDLSDFGERLVVNPMEVELAHIPLPRIALSGQLSAGQSSISGTVAPETMAPSPTVPAAADALAGTPKVTGNVPLLSVEVADPLTKLVTRTPLLVNGAPGSTSTMVPVNADGTFTLPLKTALTAGQQVRIIASPPAGYEFDEKGVSDCNLGAPNWARRDPSLVGKAECVVEPNHARQELQVYSALPLVQPTISSKLGLNATTITGIATPSTTGATGTTILIGVERFPLGDPCTRTPPDRILTTDHLSLYSGCKDFVEGQRQNLPKQLADLSIAASGAVPASSANTVQTQANGSFSLTLATPLAEEEGLRIAQILPPGTTFSDQKRALDFAYSPLITVPSVADWGRVHADFVAGLLVTNSNQIGSSDSGTFSQAHQFIDLSVEKGWLLPGCYLQSNGDCLRKVFDFDSKRHMRVAKSTVKPGDKDEQAARNDYPPMYVPEDQNWWNRHHPGIVSSFEGRLTAIQVTSVGGAATTTTGSSGSTSSSTSSSSTLLTSNFLTTAQTARFGVNTYFPTLLQRWNWHGTPNALFIAPLAKVGFDSVTGATTINVPTGTPGASSGGTFTLEPLYNFWGFGARIGHLQLGRSENKSPETESYFDVTFGPYSSLQSYVCHRTAQDLFTKTVTDSSTSPAKVTTSTVPVYANGDVAATNYSGSSCAADYPAYYAPPVLPTFTFTQPANSTVGNPSVTYTDQMSYSYQPVDSRKRLYRLDFEGLLKVPMTPLYLGFNANLAQKTEGASMLDHGYAAPDNLSIFFGTKFDIGNLLARLGITPF